MWCPSKAFCLPKPTDLTAVGSRGLARMSNGSQEREETLTGPCWQGNGSSNGNMCQALFPISLPGLRRASALGELRLSGFEGDDDLGMFLFHHAAGSEGEQGGSWRCTSSHISLQEMMENDCRQDEGCVGGDVNAPGRACMNKLLRHPLIEPHVSFHSFP